MRKWLLFGAAVINDEVYVEIQLLKKHGMSLRQIAKEVNCAVNTVRSHLAAQGKPKYERKVKRKTKLADYEDYLRRQAAASPKWIPATVLFREIVARGYQGGESQLRAFLRMLKPQPAQEADIRFETEVGEQMQVDWVEFRKGSDPLYAFSATLGYSRASYVEFVDNMKAQTLISCHEHAFAAFGGVPKRVLYDNMKTVVIERDAFGDGQHRFHPGFLDYSRHSGFIIKLCRPFRAQTKGKVERFNGYLRRSFYVPLASNLSPAGLKLDVQTANIHVKQWLADVAHELIHGTTGVKPSERLRQEQPFSQTLPPAWRGEIVATKAQPMSNTDVGTRPPQVLEHLNQTLPEQRPLDVYEQLLTRMTEGEMA